MRQFTLGVTKTNIMKKAKFFVVISAFTLAICAFAATKANKKFVSVPSGAFNTGIGSATGLIGFTTTANQFTHLVQLIKTNGSSGSGTVLGTLVTSMKAGAKKVYHN